MVRILLVGSDYQLVPPSRLEKLSACSEQIQARLLELKARGVIRGGLLLSTCNRFEVLLDLQEQAEDGASEDAMSRGLLGCDSSFPLRRLADAEAIEHLLGVATGLHSMVFGEEQILGQVRRTFKTAEEFGLLSRRLHMLRSRLLSAAREVRSRAGLDHRPRSMAAMAVDRVITAGPRIAVIGAGETGRLLLEILERRHVEKPLVVNRTFAKAEALARHFGGEAVSLNDFLRERPRLDGLVCAIHSARPVLTRECVAGVKVVVDISQPSVIAGELRRVPGLDVCDLDDLAASAETERAQYAEAKTTGLAEARALAQRLWQEVGTGRPNLGRVVDLHVEGALVELEHALNGKLSHLADADRDAIRSVFLRAAKRNAHYHIKDIRQLAIAQ